MKILITAISKLPLRLPLALALALALAGCAKNEGARQPTGDQAKEPTQEATDTPEPPSKAVDEHEQHAQGGKQEAAIPQGYAKEFHDVLHPLWHAPAGEDRMKKVCYGGTYELTKKAEAIRDDPTPEEVDDSNEWLARSKALVASVEALKAACAEAGQPSFEARFSDVHHAFEKLIELARK